MTMTELLKRVDWRAVEVKMVGDHAKLRLLGDKCPVDYVCGVLRGEVDTATYHNVIGAVDEYIHSPGRARWRQWMLEQMAAAQR